MGRDSPVGYDAVEKNSAKKRTKKTDVLTSDEEEEEEFVGEDVETTFDIEAANKAIASFRSSNRRLPKPNELMALASISDANAVCAIKLAKSAMNKRALARKRARVRGTAKLAAIAGYVEESQNFFNGIDSHTALISLSNVVNCATFLPTPDAIAYNEVEFAKRLELASTGIPQSCARALSGPMEAMFRGVISNAVNYTLSRGTQRVSASTILSAAAPIIASCELSAGIHTGITSFAQGDAHPTKDASEKAKKAYAKIPFADRGIGLVEVDKKSAEYKKIHAELKNCIASNVAAYAAKTKETDEKRAAKRARDETA
jgi:hypothetical protein